MMTPCFTGLNRTNLVAVLPLSMHKSECVCTCVCSTHMLIVHESINGSTIKKTGDKRMIFLMTKGLGVSSLLMYINITIQFHIGAH